MFRSVWLVLLLSMSICAMADEKTRTITVNGNGSAEVEPDKATLQMSIVAREPTVGVAQKAASSVTNKVLKMTDRMGVDRDKVDTTGASVRPDYRWNREKEEQELRGYIVERRIVVEIEDLEKLGELVEGAVSAGVNQVSPRRSWTAAGAKRRTARRCVRRLRTPGRTPISLPMRWAPSSVRSSVSTPAPIRRVRLRPMPAACVRWQPSRPPSKVITQRI